MNKGVVNLKDKYIINIDKNTKDKMMKLKNYYEEKIFEQVQEVFHYFLERPIEKVFKDLVPYSDSSLYKNTEVVQITVDFKYIEEYYHELQKKHIAIQSVHSNIGFRQFLFLLFHIYYQNKQQES